MPQPPRNPFADALSARRTRQNDSVMSRRAPPRATAAPDSAQGEVLRWITLPSGKRIPITSPSGQREVIRSPGAKFYTDPGTGEPVELDLLHPGGVKSAWDGAKSRTDSKTGDVFKELPGHGRKVIGKDPHWENAQAQKTLKEEQTAQAKARKDEAAAAKAAGLQAEKDRAAEADEAKRQREMEKVGIGASKRLVEESDEQFYQESRAAREKAVLARTDASSDRRRLTELDNALENETDTGKRERMEEARKRLADEITAKDARVEELEIEATRAAARQEAWLSHAKPAMEKAIGAAEDESRIKLLHNTGRRAPVQSAPAALPKGAVINPKAGQPGEPGIVSEKPAAAEVRRVRDAFAEIDGMNEVLAARDASVRIDYVAAAQEGFKAALPRMTPLPGMNVPKNWLTPSAALAQKTAREVGKADIPLPEGYDLSPPVTGVGAHAGEQAISRDGHQVGRIVRDGQGVPRAYLSGTHSPSYANYKPYDGVPEYADVAPPFRDYLTTQEGYDAQDEDSLRAAWSQRHWPAARVKEILTGWQAANDDERAELLLEMQPEREREVEAWRKKGGTLPLPNLRQLWQEGAISRQDARLMERTFSGTLPGHEDITVGWNTFRAGRHKAAQAYQSALKMDPLTDGGSDVARRQKVASEAAAAAYLSEYFQRNHARVDFDLEAFNRERDTLLGSEPVNRLRAGLEEAGQNVAGSMAGIATMLGKAATLQLSGNERDMIAKQTGIAHWGLGNVVRDIFAPGSKNKDATGAADELFAAIDRETLTETQVKALAAKIQKAALGYVTTQELAPEQQAFYDALNPESPLAAALLAYKETRDPAYKALFTSAMLSTPSVQEMQQRVAAHASDNDRIARSDAFAVLRTSFRGGQVAPLQEVGLEIASNLVGFGMGKLLTGTTRAARAATAAGRGANLAQRAVLKFDDMAARFSKWGTNPATPGLNMAVQGGKMLAASGAGEAVEEGVMALHESGATFADVWAASVQGALGGMLLMPLHTAGGMGMNAVSRVVAEKRALNAFVKDWNQARPDDPLTARDAKQLQGYLPAERESKTFEDLRAVGEALHAHQQEMIKAAGSPEALLEIQKTGPTHPQWSQIATVLEQRATIEQQARVAAAQQSARVEQARAAMQEVNGIADPTLRAFADAALRHVSGHTLTRQERRVLESARAGVPPGPVPKVAVASTDPAAKKGAVEMQDAASGVPLAQVSRDGAVIITEAGLRELNDAMPRTARALLPVDERGQWEAWEQSQTPASQNRASQNRASQTVAGHAGTETPSSGTAAGEIPESTPSQTGGSAGASAEQEMTPRADGVDGIGTNVPQDVPHGTDSGLKPGVFTVPVTVSGTNGGQRVQQVGVQAASPEEAAAKVGAMPAWKALRRAGATVTVGEVRGAAATVPPAEGRGAAQGEEGEWSSEPEAARAQVKPLAQVLRDAAAGFGYKIVDTGLPFGYTDRWGTFHSFGTQIFDKAMPGSDIGHWMDNVGNSPVADMIRENMGGAGLHRVWFGHDPLANVGAIIDKFGLGALPEYAAQLLKDMTTKSGIPLPGVQWLVHKGIVGDSAATEWLSLNVGEALGAGLGILGSYKLYKRAKNGQEIHAGWALLGIGFKLTGGVLGANPLLILTGLADTAILVGARRGWFKAGFQKARELARATATAAAVGAAPAQGTGQGVGQDVSDTAAPPQAQEQSTPRPETRPAQDKGAARALQSLRAALRHQFKAFDAIESGKVATGGGMEVERTAGGKIILRVDPARFLSFHHDSPAALVRQLVDHEVIHAATLREFTDEEMAGLFSRLPGQARQHVYEAYFKAQIMAGEMPAKPVRWSATLNNKLGHEMMRMLLEDRVFQRMITEAAQADPSLAAEIRRFLERLVQSLRDLLAKADPALAAEVRDFENRAIAALHRLGVEVPGRTTPATPVEAEVRNTGQRIQKLRDHVRQITPDKPVWYGITDKGIILEADGKQYPETWQARQHMAAKARALGTWYAWDAGLIGHGGVTFPPGSTDLNSTRVPERLSPRWMLVVDPGILDLLRRDEDSAGAANLFRTDEDERVFYDPSLTGITGDDGPVYPDDEDAALEVATDPPTAEEQTTPEREAAVEVLNPNSELRSEEAEQPAAVKLTLDEEAQEAATSPQNDTPPPTPAQKEAGNYQKGHLRIAGLDISIENPEGSERSGKSKDGKAWSVTMRSHYGYIRGTVGRDKDHLDVFVRPGLREDYSGPVHIVNQANPETGAFDEHKIMIGWLSRPAATKAYKENYAAGWKGMNSLVTLDMAQFKEWLETGDHKQPAADPKPDTGEGVGQKVSDPTPEAPATPAAATGASEALKEAARAEFAGLLGESPPEKVNSGVELPPAEGVGQKVSDPAPPAAETPNQAKVRKAKENAKKKQPGKPEDKIEDFGEKIGGARKDGWKLRGLNVSDLDGMTVEERDGHTTKDQVWPKPDHFKATLESVPQDDGSVTLRAPEPARAEEYGRRRLPPEKREGFIKLAGKMDAEGVNTPEKLAAFLDETFPGGAARPYSQALWTAIGVVNQEAFEAAGRVDWAALYGETTAAGDQPGGGGTIKSGASPQTPGTRSFAPVTGADIVTQSQESSSLVDEDAARVNTAPTSKPSLQHNPSTARAVADIAHRIQGGTVAGQGRMTQPELVRLVETGTGKKVGAELSIKDVYDLMEMAVNRVIEDHLELWNPLTADASAAVKAVTALKTRVLDILPTMTRRTAEMDKMQQFSTPPSLAYAAAWAANLQPIETETYAGKAGMKKNRIVEGSGEVVLEPSAGLGGLAVWAKKAGAEIIANELSPRRAELLKQTGIADTVTVENAELLHAIYEPRIAAGGMRRPTVVVMNPPFSNAATSRDKSTKIGALHVEQALRLLPVGGRLVAIVGRGMADDAPAFKAWWTRMKRDYAVRANVRVDGREYQRYGTTFDNQLVIIDKLPPAADAVTLTGAVRTVEELIPLIAPIRNDRGNRSTEPAADQPAGVESPQTPGSGAEPAAGASAGTGTGRSRGGQSRRPRGRGQRGNAAAGGVVAGAEDPGAGDAVSPSGDGQPGPTAGPADGGTVEPDTGSPGPGLVRADPAGTDAASRDELSEEDIFATYRPRKAVYAGAADHPSPLVESAAMASVEAPDVTYTPKLDPKVITEGRLSAAQLEAVTYAGQAHQRELPTGERAGFFIGDGTGVGKGRELAGIIADNWNQGRKRAVWISKSKNLSKDARRDLDGVGLTKAGIIELGKVKTAGKIEAKEGVLFATYATLKGGHDGIDATTKQPKGSKGKKSRLMQLHEWLGADYDGVIALDEAHMAGNAMDMKATRGMKKASATGLSIVDLQTLFPKARVVYASATGATEPSNFSYAQRLGLWGPGTPFASREKFFQEIAAQGVSAMEVLARDLKALGSYIARTLSFKGVDFSRVTHSVSPEQRKIYDEMADSWQMVYANVDQAMGITGANKNGNARSAAMSAFWSANQRFFNQILTAMQMPTVLADMKAKLADGGSVVVQLTNTNEAIQERALAQREDESDEDGETNLDNLDMSPKDVLLQFVQNSWPTAKYIKVVDDNGNEKWVVAQDADGKPVVDPDAVALREETLSKLASLKVPDNPLEQILETFGAENVSEITGRSRRVVTKPQPDGTRKRVIEDGRSDAKRLVESKEFQDGKRRVLVFSDAGGTGFSYHAAAGVKNRQRRYHYLVQAGWRADTALQGFGRTHRSDQVQTPFYVLCSTDIKGHQRFISTIARRLAQLGALTTGERKAAGQGMFSETDNLESSYAKMAVKRLFYDLFAGRVPGFDFADITMKMGYVRREVNERTGATVAVSTLIDKKNNTLDEGKLPTIQQFLNRILAVNFEEQNRLFEAFMERMERMIAQAKEGGYYDPGTQTFKADKIEAIGSDSVYTHPGTSAGTRITEVKASRRIHYTPFDFIARRKPEMYVRNTRSGRVYALADGGHRTTESGAIVDLYTRISPTGSENVPKHDVFLGDGESEDVGMGWRKDEKTGRVFRPDSKAGGANYEKLTEAKARELWDAEVESGPEFSVDRDHFLVGMLLPIWDRAKMKTMRIFRVNPENSPPFLGLHIHPKELDAVRARLGAGAVNRTPVEWFDLLIKQGQVLDLANGWRVQRTRSLGDYRIEVVGPQWEHKAEFESWGGFTERVSWTLRWFMPGTEAEGQAALEKLLARHPVVSGAEGLTLGAPEPAGVKSGSTAGGAATTGGAETLPDIPQWGALQQELRQWRETTPDKAAVKDGAARIMADYHARHPQAAAALEARKALSSRVGRPIPPAWTGVQVFPPGSRLLAKGRDDKGRLQSIYSAADTQASLASKFARQKRVNSLMPRILDGVKDGLARGSEEAAVLRLIYLTGFRNGGEGDTGAKVKAYGATTLLAEHVTIEGDEVRFDFTGKLGVRQQHVITDAALAADLRARQVRGGRLFNTTPEKVLSALRAAAGTQDIKVHDLRTWNATALADKLVRAEEAPSTELDYWLKRDAIADVVARKLGDTRKIVLESYIDPIVFEKWLDALTLPHDAERPTISRKAAADRGSAGELRGSYEAYERALRDELLPSAGEGGWAGRDGGLSAARTTVRLHAPVPARSAAAHRTNIVQQGQRMRQAAAAPAQATGGKLPTARGAAQDGGSLITELFYGRHDRLEAILPGTKRLIQEHRLDAGFARAAVKSMMDQVRARITDAFGTPKFWSVKRRAKMARFLSELLPVASRLNVTGHTPAGDLVFTAFDRPVGFITDAEMKRAGYNPGDAVPMPGTPASPAPQMVNIGPRATERGGHVLTEPVPAAVQEQLYTDFSHAYPEGAWVMEEFIMPGMDTTREVGPGGTVTPTFNRGSLLNYLNDDWPPALQALFTAQPLPPVALTEGWTPDMARQKTAVAYLGALLRNFIATARKTRTGERIESGELHDLLEGFEIAAFEGQMEKSRLAIRNKLINQTARGVPPPATGLGDYLRAWTPMDDVITGTLKSYVLSRKADMKLIPNKGGPLTAEQRALATRLLGDGVRFWGTDMALPRRIYQEFIAAEARDVVTNRLLRAVDFFIKRYVAGLMVDLGTFFVNIASNPVLRQMAGLNRLFYALTSALHGDWAGAKLGALEWAHLMRGLVQDQLPLLNRRITAALPPEIYDDNTSYAQAEGIDPMKGALAELKDFNPGAAFLKAVRYGAVDQGAKVGVHYALLRARASLAADAAKVGGVARRAFVTDWMNHARTRHRQDFDETYQQTLDFMLDMANDVPAVVDPSQSLFTPGQQPSQLERVVKRGVFSLYRFKAAMLRYGVRNTAGSVRALFDPMLTAGRKAQAGANLLMMTALGAFGWLLTGDDGEDDPLVGRMMDDYGRMLPQAARTGDRVNISKAGRKIAAWLRRHGVPIREDGAVEPGTTAEDLWLKTSKLPLTSSALLLGHLANGHYPEAFDMSGQMWTDLMPAGPLLRLNPLTYDSNYFDKGKSYRVVAADQLFDLLTAPVLPSRLRESVVRIVDPQDRLLKPEPDIGYNPGLKEVFQTNIPWLSLMVPPRATYESAPPERFSAQAWRREKLAAIARADGLAEAERAEMRAEVEARFPLLLAAQARQYELLEGFGIPAGFVNTKRAGTHEWPAELQKLKDKGYDAGSGVVATGARTITRDGVGKSFARLFYPQPDSLTRKTGKEFLLGNLTGLNILPVKQGAVRAALEKSKVAIERNRAARDKIKAAAQKKPPP